MGKRAPRKIWYGDDSLGMQCPACNCRDFRTLKTEKRAGYVKRYKACRHCDRRVITQEMIAGADVGPAPAEDERGDG